MDAFSEILICTIEIKILFNQKLDQGFQPCNEDEYRAIRDFSEDFELWFSNSNVEYKDCASEELIRKITRYLVHMISVMKDLRIILEELVSQAEPGDNEQSHNSGDVGSILQPDEYHLFDKTDSEPESLDETDSEPESLDETDSEPESLDETDSELESISDEGGDVKHENINLCLKSLYRLSSILSDLEDFKSILPPISLKEFVSFSTTRVYSKTDYYSRALHQATKHCLWKLAAILIQRGADVNSRDRSGQTALFMAVRSGKEDMINTLMQHGADVNFHDISGQTALFMAVRSGKEDMINILMQHGADVDSYDRSSQTALFMAVRSGKGDMINILIKYGADVDYEDKYGVTALYLAVKLGRSHTVGLLIQNKANVHHRNKYGETALHAAAEYGNLDVVETLVNLDAYEFIISAKINCPDNLEQTPLYLAVGRGHLEVARFLIQRRAGINSADRHGETVLHKAVCSGSLEMVKLLIRYKVDINHVNRYGETGFCMAWRYKNFEVADFLYQSGATVDLDLITDDDSHEAKKLLSCIVASKSRQTSRRHLPQTASSDFSPEASKQGNDSKHDRPSTDNTNKHKDDSVPSIDVTQSDELGNFSRKLPPKTARSNSSDKASESNTSKNPAENEVKEFVSWKDFFSPGGLEEQG